MWVTSELGFGTAKVKFMASRFPLTLTGPRAFPSNVVAILVVCTAFVLITAAAGCLREEDLTIEQRSHQLASQLMCPVCDGQTIDGSNAQIAQDMRAKVHELLEDGDSNDEIREYFIVRYGEGILAAPASSGFNLIAWIVPMIIVAGGIGTVLLTIKNMRRSNMASKAFATRIAAIDSELSEYLHQVDSELSAISIKEAGQKDARHAPNDWADS